jgi:type IV pilus assembly protein PilV
MHQLNKGGGMKRQQGFSLIEILVTMVVTSIGLLGIAGLIVTSLNNNKGAYARTQTTLLANDIVDRMRANRGVAEGATFPYNLALDTKPSGTGIVNEDLIAWRASVAQSVPEGKGSVSFDKDTMNVTIVIQWNDSHSKGPGTTVGLEKQKVTIETRL